MTEIKVKLLDIYGRKRFCVVDNHNHKKSTTFQIIYKSKEWDDIEKYMIEKGLKG